MKRIALSALALMSVLAFASVAQAETKLSSFNVVSLAYQGRLMENGIPGYGSLEAGVNFGTITAEDVIQAAIDSGRLTEDSLQDSEFILAVGRQLQSLTDHE